MSQYQKFYNNEMPDSICGLISYKMLDRYKCSYNDEYIAHLKKMFGNFHRIDFLGMEKMKMTKKEQEDFHWYHSSALGTLNQKRDLNAYFRIEGDKETFVMGFTLDDNLKMYEIRIGTRSEQIEKLLAKFKK